MIYLLDTNVISDLTAGVVTVFRQFDHALERGNTVSLCPPVLYEVRRGFVWRRSPTKSRVFDENILPRLTYVPLTDADWLLAAQFWADAVSRGRQLADVDLLLAALAQRLGAALVTADDDFDILPIQRANWRIAQPS